ncbi:PQQ-binding-like beta-propeller repeat protein [Formosa sp. PL04]|uniref:outer membrane protein assembly factor BamB family protein n=1 Tax=Formosa sp. PL04 TaxID=3081755 RepID=UPI0029813174|nr:PQQ-binding-like beta-propeller repeat protein [Formosa sp. PL04]MDW5290127.1 PQQ-binding-like beta-propeller repeat protein [Formosa sp. PL04]
MSYKQILIKSIKYIILSLISILNLGAQEKEDFLYNLSKQWPMASGPNGNWTLKTENTIPTAWSVSNNQNVLWKTKLPEGGQSGIAVWGNKLFLTINKPLPEGTLIENTEGSDIIGYCLNTNTGKVEWTLDIPSPKKMPYSGLFSDNSTPTPITNGKHVWFINAGGLIVCSDMDGNTIWKRPFESRMRHAAKQCEPIMIDNQLLYVMMRDSGDTLRKPMKALQSGNKTDPELWPWTFIRAFDADTGTPLWVESTGTSVHNTPQIGYIDNKPAIFHLRGGGHTPPETPYGFNMSWASGKKAGESIWSYKTKNIFAYTVTYFDENFAYGIDDGCLLKFNSKTGVLLNRFQLFDQVEIHKWNTSKNKYETYHNVSFDLIIDKYRKIPTNETTILIGKYFLFMTHEGHCIGRVDTETGKVVYIQVPIQIARNSKNKDDILWNTHIPSDGINSRGVKTGMDKRAQRDGWGHVTSGNPIAINNYVFFSTMIGMTYVIDSQQETFDDSALISINDLGPAGSTWSLSTLSYSQEKIFHRGLKQVVCIKKITD